MTAVAPTQLSKEERRAREVGVARRTFLRRELKKGKKKEKIKNEEEERLWL